MGAYLKLLKGLILLRFASTIGSLFVLSVTASDAEIVADDLNGYWTNNFETCQILQNLTVKTDIFAVTGYSNVVVNFGPDSMAFGDGQAIVFDFIDHGDHFSMRYDWGIAPEDYLLIGVLDQSRYLTLFFPLNDKVASFSRCS